jgi:hypothetical protein
MPLVSTYVWIRQHAQTRRRKGTLLPQAASPTSSSRTPRQTCHPDGQMDVADRLLHPPGNKSQSEHVVLPAVDHVPAGQMLQAIAVVLAAYAPATQDSTRRLAPLRVSLSLRCTLTGPGSLELALAPVALLAPSLVTGATAPEKHTTAAVRRIHVTDSAFCSDG